MEESIVAARTNKVPPSRDNPASSPYPIPSTRCPICSSVSNTYTTTKPQREVASKFPTTTWFGRANKSVVFLPSSELSNSFQAGIRLCCKDIVGVGEVTGMETAEDDLAFPMANPTMTAPTTIQMKATTTTTRFRQFVCFSFCNTRLDRICPSISRVKAGTASLNSYAPSSDDESESKLSVSRTIDSKGTREGQTSVITNIQR